MRDKIDRWYKDVVEALTKAASASVPRVKNGTLKHFWDDDLNELKKLSINSHNLWVEAGKPRSGDIYLNRTRDIFNYKSAINEKKLVEKCSVSSDLHESLLNKKIRNFGKRGKAKSVIPN